MLIYNFLLTFIITDPCNCMRRAEEALWTKRFDNIGTGDFGDGDGARVVDVFEEYALGVDLADLHGDVEVGVRGAGHVEDGFDVAGDLCIFGEVEREVLCRIVRRLSKTKGAG